MFHDFSHASGLTIGLIADTHMPGAMAELWPTIYSTFAGVDLILHAGDLHVGGVIDALQEIAPTYVCRGNGDADVQHERLRDQWQGALAGVQLGLIHKFPTPRRASHDKLERKLSECFPGSDPRVVIYGHTHFAEATRVGERLYINPGSPTLPNNQSTRMGTLGLLSLSAEQASVKLLQITAAGSELLQTL